MCSIVIFQKLRAIKIISKLFCVKYFREVKKAITKIYFVFLSFFRFFSSKKRNLKNYHKTNADICPENGTNLPTLRRNADRIFSLFREDLGENSSVTASTW